MKPFRKLNNNVINFSFSRYLQTMGTKIEIPMSTYILHTFFKFQRFQGRTNMPKQDIRYIPTTFFLEPKTFSFYILETFLI